MVLIVITAYRNPPLLMIGNMIIKSSGSSLNEKCWQVVQQPVAAYILETYPPAVVPLCWPVLWNKPGIVKHNNADYYNNTRHCTWPRMWIKWHDRLGQISSHRVKQNIFSAQSQGHAASCPGDSVTQWLCVFHKPCFLCYGALLWRKKNKPPTWGTRLCNAYCIWNRNSFGQSTAENSGVLERIKIWVLSNELIILCKHFTDKTLIDTIIFLLAPLYQFLTTGLSVSNEWTLSRQPKWSNIINQWRFVILFIKQRANE